MQVEVEVAPLAGRAEEVDPPGRLGVVVDRLGALPRVLGAEASAEAREPHPLEPRGIQPDDQHRRRTVLRLPIARGVVGLDQFGRASVAELQAARLLLVRHLRDRRPGGDRSGARREPELRQRVGRHRRFVSAVVVDVDVEPLAHQHQPEVAELVAVGEVVARVGSLGPGRFEVRRERAFLSQQPARGKLVGGPGHLEPERAQFRVRQVRAAAVVLGRPQPQPVPERFELEGALDDARHALLLGVGKRRCCW